MKLVVPLTMPMTSRTPAASIDSRSTLTTGIAAQTEASKRSWAPWRSAMPHSSSPWRASSCLLAETTEMPRLEQLGDVAARRIDAAHHLGDDGDARVVAQLLEALGQEAGRGRAGTRCAPRRARARARPRPGGRPRGDVLGARASSASTELPTVP